MNSNQIRLHLHFYLNVIKFRDSNTAAAIFMVPEVGGAARGGGNAPVCRISRRHWKHNKKKKISPTENLL